MDRPTEVEDVAVWVRGGRHEYRRFALDLGVEKVLLGVDMTVRRGEVYTLLGSSACGKTTLLRALVGQHTLTGGEVLIFGRPPGDPGGGVPGNGVGYMPQESAVHDGFTIGEILGFHGRLVGMSPSAIRQGLARVVADLHLPGEDNLVGTLSGGERRRVSLAIALLHAPPLLVLDEPTVGVDPLLRHSIWQLLLAVAAEGTAVILSTHYVEEARQAHTVGVLRGGRMVAEDFPASLMDAFPQDADGEQDAAAEGLDGAIRRLYTCLERPESQSQTTTAPSRSPRPRPSPSRLVARGKPLQWRHKVAALLWKNSIYLWRHSLIMAVQAFFFVFITVLACASLGHWPQDVVVSVVNEEAVNCNESWSEVALSCSVIAKLPERGMQPVFLGDMEAAEMAVHSGRSWAVLHFGSNFSTALLERILRHGDSEQVLRDSAATAFLDMTDFVVSNMVRRRLVEIVMEVIDSLSPRTFSYIKLEEPLHGRREPVNTDTLMPGVLLGYMTTFAASLVMSTLLMEKMDKSMERILVTGVKMSEVMTCWVVVLLPVVMVVNLVSHVLIFGPFAIPCAGSTTLMYLLCSALCVMTMLAGLLFASVFDNYITAILACHQFAVSFVFLSGVLWPLQGMHWALRWLALLMPWSHSMEAARAVLQRGWGLGHLQVGLGFLSCAAWAAVFLAALALAHHARGLLLAQHWLAKIVYRKALD